MKRNLWEEVRDLQVALVLQTKKVNEATDIITNFESLQDDMSEEIVRLQENLDYRTKIENEAIELISQCKFEEAQELLKTI